MLVHSRIEGEGQPFLIIHGFLGMSDNWKTLSQKFVEIGYQVHSLDMRNHGKSFHDNAFNYEVMVQDVKEYLEHHELKNIVLLGHSMGGKIAMLFATTYPNMIEKLIVADIGPKYYPPHHQTILKALNAVDFSLKPTRNEVETILSTFIHDFGTRQFLLKNLYWKEPGQLAFRFNLKVFNEKINEIGAALPFDKTYNGKVLFLRGDKSDYILDSDFETIYFHFSKAKIVTISGAGHWLHAENPKDFFCEVENFLN